MDYFQLTCLFVRMMTLGDKTAEREREGGGERERERGGWGGGGGGGIARS